MSALTVAEAASRVRRSRRTIETWISDGLPATTIGGIRYIAEEDLLTVYREKLQAPKGGKGKPRNRRVLAE